MCERTGEGARASSADGGETQLNHDCEVSRMSIEACCRLVRYQGNKSREIFALCAKNNGHIAR